MAYQLGIDLGTTYTAAAVCRSSDRGWTEPEVVTLGSRSATVASVLFLAPDGSVLVGEAAERRALTDPARVVREFKRRIGDPTPIVVGGRNWAPEELSARLVRWVVDRVAEREGGPADRIAITHPASWGQLKRDLLARALAGQGLTVTFLAEPQAAALHYATAERVGAGATIAVYDLGGGTFDAAVVRKGDPGDTRSGPAGFGLLGRPEGLERLGGIDFDEVVFEHVRAGLPDAFDNLDDTDPAVLSAVSRIRRDCTEAKEALSSDTEVSIPVLLPGSRGSVRMHRSEFEQVIHARIEETVEALRKAVSSAGLTPEQLTAVLLVGGSSRIPLVAQLVSELLARPVAVDADPKNAIAKGAALALAPRTSNTMPGGTIPPVGPGRGPAAAPGTGPLAAPGIGPVAARAPGGPAVAPARPARPGERPLGAGPPRPATPPPPPPAPRRTVPPVHEPAATLYSAGAEQAPFEQSWAPRREREPAWAAEPAWEPEPEPPPRRPFGFYVGVAGLAAVALIVVVLLWWPDTASNFGVNTGNLGGDPSATSTSAPEPTTRRGARTTNPAVPAPAVPGTRPPTQQQLPATTNPVRTITPEPEPTTVAPPPAEPQQPADPPSAPVTQDAPGDAGGGGAAPDVATKEEVPAVP